MPSPLPVAGADGCRAGWLVVRKDADHPAKAQLVFTFADLLDATRDCAIVAVDIPIGLLDHARPGGRECDRAARSILRPKRASSVFSPPVRAALDAPDYAAARRINRDSSELGIALSAQCFGLFPKLREIDHAITPDLQQRIREVHPELCFAQLNGGTPLPHPKRSPEGRALRLELLARAGFPEAAEALPNIPKSVAAPDDILDAFAACWTARRIANGHALRLPDDPPRDARGLRMEMWM